LLLTALDTIDYVIRLLPAQSLQYIEVHLTSLYFTQKFAKQNRWVVVRKKKGKSQEKVSFCPISMSAVV